MSKPTNQFSTSVEVVDYNPDWPNIYEAERELILGTTDFQIVELEHIGSTAIPSQRAKPIVDMMAAIYNLNEFGTLLPALHNLGYQLIETGMRHRFFLRKQERLRGQVFHLHVVELSTWSTRKERLMRDYLLKHPEDVEAYGALKDRLAATYPGNSLEYTRAKTDFIQDLFDKVCDSLGLPHIDVWND